MEDSYRKRMLLGQDGNALIQLIVINAVLFVILKFIYVVYILSDLKGGPFYTNLLSWFALPASLGKLATRPWTLITYMFSDHDLFRFIANMLWLWGFGYILQDFTGNRKLVPIYLYGGLAGAVLFLLVYAVFPGLHIRASDAILLGASPAVIAVAIATTTVAPDYRIFPMINGGIPLWILTIIYLLITFSGIPRGDAGGYLAGLSGAGGGFLFIYLLRRGHDGSIWMNQFFDWCNDLFNPDRRKKARSAKDEFYYKVSGTQPFKKIPNVTQQRIDEILDKINQQGYRFLTDEEKEILKRAADEEDL
ncbi:rhomboid family intramembrane serine protease [Flavitalea flava]